MSNIRALPNETVTASTLTPIRSSRLALAKRNIVVERATYWLFDAALIGTQQDKRRVLNLALGWGDVLGKREAQEASSAVLMRYYACEERRAWLNRLRGHTCATAWSAARYAQKIGGPYTGLAVMEELDDTILVARPETLHLRTQIIQVFPNLSDILPFHQSKKALPPFVESWFASLQEWQITIRN